MSLVCSYALQGVLVTTEAGGFSSGVVDAVRLQKSKMGSDFLGGELLSQRLLSMTILWVELA